MQSYCQVMRINVFKTAIFMILIQKQSYKDACTDVQVNKSGRNGVKPFKFKVNS